MGAKRTRRPPKAPPQSAESPAMAARESAATVRALALVERGWTAYRAAKHVGIALSTIYRAVARQRARERVEEMYREREARSV